MKVASKKAQGTGVYVAKKAIMAKKAPNMVYAQSKVFLAIGKCFDKIIKSEIQKPNLEKQELVLQLIQSKLILYQVQFENIFS